MSERYVPSGSYQKSAQDISVHLYAKAQKRDQDWIDSGADITHLQGGLVNLDGSLHPENAAEPSSGFVPSGSYERTSRDVDVVLTARCRTRSGDWLWSTLDITRYDPAQGDIANIDGNLTIQ